ncbi:polysaccharide biosynthesis/export family protein [Accumulibacter sp.]|uniref:polysaccharide biosynthesis/export family protein n=1 Tax=Accumulibacter sp. TaxID=2053492 RepID=UPI00257980C0|nr:polysaccharide biosynthesis/export family protein [Accumulibacter sp.]
MATTTCCRGSRALTLAAGVAAALLAGCSTFPDWLPSSGPSRQQVIEVQEGQPDSLIQVVSVTDRVARRLVASQQQQLFSQVLASKAPFSYTIGPGDVLEVSVWEAPPAVLFGAPALDPRSGVAAARSTAFPEQMVSSEGTLNIPFAGSLQVAGKTPQQVENEVVRRLSGKANQPQALVRVIRNATSNVTVVGEVAASTRMPLTARGERLLDALAAAGGVRQPVGKVTLQLTRGEQVHALALETIIRDPKQNIALQPGDVITALFQPLSFIVLGATAKNEEVNFEAQGITLAQALARVGGVQDRLADARAVFIFRFEDPAVLDLPAPPRTTPEGKVPVVYEVNLKNPETFFLAQGFPVLNRDVLYVANSPGAELQKFLGIIMPAAYSVLNTYNVTK